MPDATSDRVLRAATRTYLLISGAGSLFFSMIVTVNLLYHVETVGLSPLQLVLVGTMLETAIVVFEIPTGVVADLVSRRRSILIGYALTGIGFVLEGSIPTFIAIMLAQGVWGIGYTFTSGATEAWITDEVGEDAVGHVMLRGSQAALAGAIVGVLLGTGLGLLQIQLPIVLGGAGYILMTLVLLRVMPETNFHPTPRADRSTWHHMGEIARDGLSIARSRPVVRVLLLTSFLVGLSSEAFDRLWTKHLIDTFSFPDVPGDSDLVLWFGIIHLVGMIFSLVATEALKRFHPESLAPGTPARLLASLAAGRVVTTVLFALAGWLWLALGALWVRSMLASMTEPVGAAWMHRNIEPRSRATVISFREQVASLGEIGGGPPLGAVGNRFGVTTALFATALVYLPAVAAYLRVSQLHDREHINEQGAEEHP